MQEDGDYIRANDGKKPHSGFSAQEFLMRLAEGKVELDAIPKSAKASATEGAVASDKAPAEKPRPEKPRPVKPASEKQAAAAQS
jgi:hypothetical protein